MIMNGKNANTTRVSFQLYINPITTAVMMLAREDNAMPSLEPVACNKYNMLPVTRTFTFNDHSCKDVSQECLRHVQTRTRRL